MFTLFANNDNGPIDFCSVSDVSMLVIVGDADKFLVLRARSHEQAVIIAAQPHKYCPDWDRPQASLSRRNALDVPARSSGRLSVIDGDLA